MDRECLLKASKHSRSISPSCLSPSSVSGRSESLRLFGQGMTAAGGSTSRVLLENVRHPAALGEQAAEHEIERNVARPGLDLGDPRLAGMQQLGQLPWVRFRSVRRWRTAALTAARSSTSSRSSSESPRKSLTTPTRYPAASRALRFLSFEFHGPAPTPRWTSTFPSQCKPAPSLPTASPGDVDLPSGCALGLIVTSTSVPGANGTPAT